MSTHLAAIRPRRSVLYLPGSNMRALEKARSLPADSLILDLEDAVAPDAKEMARNQIAEAVNAKSFGLREIVVRINGLGSPWGEADLEVIAAAQPDAILIPKVETAADILEVGERLDQIDKYSKIAIWAMMETPAVMFNAESVAHAKRQTAGKRFSALVMGTNDLAKETRARLVPGRAPMLTALSLCVLAARAHGLDILDGVFTAIKDLDGLRRECIEGRDLGMDGKTLIHPDQIAVTNEVFAPAAEEVALARKIIAAFAAPEAKGKGVLTVDGKMVERLHAEIAERIVAISDAISARAN